MGAECSACRSSRRRGSSGRAVRVSRAGPGVLRIRASAAASRPRVNLEERPPRAAQRLRRALERGGPGREAGRELRLRRPVRRARPRDRRRDRAGLRSQGPRRRHLLPGAVAALEPRLRRAARQRRGEPLRPPAPRPLGGSRRRDRALAARVRRPAAGRCPAPLHRRHRPPAAAARAVGLRPVVPDRAAERDAARRGGGDRQEIPRRRRPRVGGGDPDALPALRRPSRTGGLRAGAHAAVPRGRPRAPLVLQPAPVHRLPARVRRGGCRRRAPARARWPSHHVPGLRRRRGRGRVHDRAARPVRLHRPRHGRALLAARARGARPGQGRLHGGLRRVHLARDALGRRHTACAHPQPLPARLPLRASADDARLRAPGGALPALGLDGHGALLGERVGRRPDHGLGLRRPALGRHAGAHDRDERRGSLGLGHRRLQLLRRRRAALARAARPLDPARGGVRPDAHEAVGDRPARVRAAAGVRPGIDADLAALREAPHAAAAVHRGGGRRVPGDRNAAHAARAAHRPRRRARDPRRRPVRVRHGPARGAGAASRARAGARSTCRAGAGWTSGAPGATSRATAA